MFTLLAYLLTGVCGGLLRQDRYGQQNCVQFHRFKLNEMRMPRLMIFSRIVYVSEEVRVQRRGRLSVIISRRPFWRTRVLRISIEMATFSALFSIRKYGHISFEIRGDCTRILIKT